MPCAGPHATGSMGKEAQAQPSARYNPRAPLHLIGFRFLNLTGVFLNKHLSLHSGKVVDQTRLSYYPWH